MGKVTAPSPPELLAEHHNIQGFNCGEASLDNWLARRAWANQASGATRTYVICDKSRVIAYYALAAGVIAVQAAPGRFRRNMPDPIPVTVLARLAVAVKWQGLAIARAVLRDAASRVSNAAEVIGIRGMIVHAISEDARRFYLALGFISSPLDPRTLVITLGDIRRLGL
ncbi:MAG: GNAT family N-acetyltransferase [Candidatus Hydrogenedentes bacterium]|nr:GNAT family N-acetyltransferase [Candidatus Hydrogenedentota bacterium]